MTTRSLVIRQAVSGKIRRVLSGGNAMNLKEGTRRLALLLGAAGAIVCGVLSYAQLQSNLHQRADHKRFEQLVNSEVVRQERDRRFAPLKDAKTGKPSIDPKTGTPIMVDWDEVEPINGPHNPKSESGFAEPPSEVNKQGIKHIYWARNLGVRSIETEDGDTLYPTQAPSAWSYVLIAILPVLGFFILWGAVRVIGWVGAGFAESPK
jgi:hypothetical protein